MLIVYDTKTGNVERFVNKLNLKTVKITDGLVVNEPYVLITYTTGFGEVPQETQNFLHKNGEYLKGVVSSGNRNWGAFFGKAAETISKQYNVPILLQFELSGTKEDIEALKGRMLTIELH